MFGVWEFCNATLQERRRIELGVFQFVIQSQQEMQEEGHPSRSGCGLMFGTVEDVIVDCNDTECRRETLGIILSLSFTSDFSK